MNSIIEIHAAIEGFASRITESRTSMRSIPSMEIGDYIRQGDVYVTRIADNSKHGAKITSRQLAQGSSNGSRHMAEGPISLFAPIKVGNRVKDALAGPVIVADDRWTVAHPEHADFGLPAGTFQVSYQLDWASQQKVND